MPANNLIYKRLNLALTLVYKQLFSFLLNAKKILSVMGVSTRHSACNTTGTAYIYLDLFN